MPGAKGKVAADAPAQPLQLLRQGRDASLADGIVLDVRHE
jgi:hypothetical protein